MNYAEFLARKALRVEAVGFDALPFAADLFPFQRDIVSLAYPDGFVVGGGVR